MFISKLLVAACTALLPIKRQDRPVSLGPVWPSKSPIYRRIWRGAYLIKELKPGTPHNPNPAPLVLLILLLIVYLLLFDEALQVSHPQTHLLPYYLLLYTEHFLQAVYRFIVEVMR